jgi:hypothetical protein
MTFRWFMLGSIAAVCAGCAAGAGPEAEGVPSDSAPVANDAVAAAGDSVGTVQEALDTPCVSACLQSCVCTPADGKPAACLKACRAECVAECACTASCASKACGAADGCGGVCSAGNCPLGQTCGGGGVLNQCGCAASCAGKACGAADGCGGVCSAGTCRIGTTVAGRVYRINVAARPRVWARAAEPRMVAAEVAARGFVPEEPCAAERACQTCVRCQT